MRKVSRAQELYDSTDFRKVSFDQSGGPANMPALTNTQGEGYKHPVSGAGLCGKKGGCTDCGTLLKGAQAAHATPLHVPGESHESFMGRTNGMISAIGALNSHLCDGGNGAQNVAHGHTQHIAGMGDLNMGRIKQAQETAEAMGGVQNVPHTVQQATNSVYAKSAPQQFENFSDGKGGKAHMNSVPWLHSGASGLNPIGAGGHGSSTGKE